MESDQPGVRDGNLADKFVEEEEGAKIPDVRVVVDRGAAGIEADLAAL